VANISAIRRLRFLARAKVAVKLAIVRPLVVPVVSSDRDDLEPESDSDGQVVAAPQALRAP
jgi:hypothetical protein